MTKYEELKQMLGNELFVGGKTEDGEDTIIEYTGLLDDEFSDDIVIRETIFQVNGWICIHYYHSDGTIEEMFERD